jgi:hypothetical protein
MTCSESDQDISPNVVLVRHDHWCIIKQAARKVFGEDGEGWCPICETTIGNGCVIHAEDCPLFDAKDRE